MAKVSPLLPERVWDSSEVRATRVAALSPAVLSAFAVYAIMVLRVAWASDDAFITMRTVDNFVHGHGLRWNVAERVQSYTHPLWMLLLSALYPLLRSPFFTLVIAGIACSLAATFLLTKYLARSPEQAIAALLILTASRSFVDYSTSGLENPLLHLLCVRIVWLYLSRPAALRSLCLAIALLACTRMDAALVFAPALVHAALMSYQRQGLRPTLSALLLGFGPFLLWEAFSLFYYGFLFPNTAYAKLNTGIPALSLARQGLAYLLGTLSWDPLTFAAIGLGLSLCAVGDSKPHKLLGLGTLLYLLYVVKVGGDFMAGRFLSLPLFVLVCSWARAAPATPATLLKLGLPLALLFILPEAREEFPVVNDYNVSGVADERAWYRDANSLVMYTHGEKLPAHEWKTRGKNMPEGQVIVIGTAGMNGTFAPRSTHLVDKFALTDALLARLPVDDPKHWRVGHYVRTPPEGYVETLSEGVCRLKPASLCPYYEKLTLVVRGDLWSWSRLAAIAALNLWEKPVLTDARKEADADP